MNKTACHPNFEQLRTAHIKSLNIDVMEFRHKKTGTPHIHLATDNPENVFLVGLRTVPMDSTGVAHILEHTVLCGSEKYPVRDPFFMMIRRSLNTFMNAFTSSDWTAYPFASQSRKDYFNLLDVYLDAVFFSRLHELDFAQEGHRVEFEQADDPKTDLVYKGVVYNEMKGAMSAPTSILWDKLSKYLFSHNTYHYNSGGDPEVMPQLTYEQLLNFYQTHYHPSNAVFMTYGDIPALELQSRFDSQVLERFEPLDRIIKVNKAIRLHSPMIIEEAYATEEPEDQDKTHIVLSWLLGESIDLDERLRVHLLSSVLLDNSASPLMQALEQTDLGSSPSPLCGVEDSALEMVFVCGLDGTRPEHSEATQSLILDVLADVAKNGVPQEQVDAVLHQLELSQREIRGDGMPFGLQLVLSGLSAAMQRGDAIAAIDLDPALVRLRKAALEPGFIQNLVTTLLLNNPHRVRLTLRPDNSISKRRSQMEKKRLAEKKASLDELGMQEIVAQANALAERQLQEDDPDILPKVTLKDVPANMHIPEGNDITIANAPARAFTQGTNGLVYQHVVMDLPALDKELLPLLPLYTGFLTELGSGGRDYIETQKRQAEVTGGIGAYTMQRGATDDVQNVSAYLVLRGKALLRNSSALTDLLYETLTSTKFNELTRLRELIAQSRAGREQSVTGSGHLLAMTAAASGMSPTTQFAHLHGGLAGIKSLKKLDDSLDDDKNLSRLAEQFEAIHQQIQQAPRQFMLVAEGENMDVVQAGLHARFSDNIESGEFSAYKPQSIRERVQQIWTTSTEVSFCARAYPVVPSGHEDAAALTVLGPFLRNGYLHRAIRETGGAYGGGASYDADSASFRFYSYRDPRLVDTLDDFDKSVIWLRETTHDPQALEEAILNVVGSIDKPGSPAGEARSAFQNELFGRSAELRQAYRDRILTVSLDDLKRVSESYFAADLASTAVISNTNCANTSPVKALELENVEL